MADKVYNTTQLHPQTTFERHVYHRDQFAHFLRWTHVLKRMKIGMSVLDFGSGTSLNLAEVFYRNRFKANTYLGLDIRKLDAKGIKLQTDVDWIDFKQEDLVNMGTFHGNNWDMITSFEVIEHVGKQNADKFMQNIKRHCKHDTTVLISTPNYDANVGAADNHTYDSGDGRGHAPQEFYHHELVDIFTRNGFDIVEKYGTFASIRDYKDKMNKWQREMFDNLSNYYDTNLLSVIMAPFFPEEARNCLFVLKLKQRSDNNADRHTN